MTGLFFIITNKRGVEIILLEDKNIVDDQEKFADTNASPSAYGWAFQVGAGIKLMLDNIADFTALKMEGKDDDIEISLLMANFMLKQNQ